MKKRRFLSSGSPFEEEVGYSRAVIQDDWAFVSGTTGFDYAKMTIAEDVVEQTEQCFRNIVATLETEKFSILDVVSIRTYFDRREDWPLIAPVIFKWCSKARPTSTAIVASLVDPRMKVEIEVTAKRLGT